jgi:hypothetical protein
VKSYLALLLGLWAVGTRHAQMVGQPQQSTEIDGNPTKVDMFMILGPGGKAEEQFLVLVTDMPDGTYELRLVRQIL